MLQLPGIQGLQVPAELLLVRTDTKWFRTSHQLPSLLLGTAEEYWQQWQCALAAWGPGRVRAVRAAASCAGTDRANGRDS